VQRCTKVNDRVCDTVYDLAVTTKDDFQRRAPNVDEPELQGEE